MDESWLEGRKILVLEPRRIAARAAAERMAHSLSEAVGERIGLRARMVSKSGPKTRIEVVTEGVFTGMILDDPELSGIGAVLFDEFHERSLDADLGLALALDCQRGLRDDLRILPMSATLDGARVAQLLGDAPVIASEGRAFPVDTRYLGRDANARIEDQMADAVMRALRAETGSILAFLPGQGEIRRVEERLKERISDPAIVLAPLYGAMDMKAQDLALEPAPPGLRKVVLATSIAETSITIEGVRVVIDSGLARVPRFEPDVGVTRLETVRVSRAAADQRRGRAGRTRARRLLSPVGRAANAEPARFRRARDSLRRSGSACCSTARNGEPPIRARCPGSIRRRRPPSTPRASELTELEALDADGRITASGQAAEVAAAAAPACPHGDFRSRARPRGGGCRDRRGDGGARTGRQRCRSRASAGQLSAATARAAPATCASWRPAGLGWRGAGRSAHERSREDMSLARLLALAFPERIGKARGAPGQFLLANGRGANLDATHPLARIAVPGRCGAVGIGGVDAHPARGRSR